MSPTRSKTDKPPKSEREDRLAEKLRENLSRRKAQKRQRHSSESVDTPDKDPKTT